MPGWGLWLGVALFVVAWFTSLSLQVIAGRFGATVTEGASVSGDSSLARAGPVLDLSGGTPRWFRSPPQRELALTFDDGPQGTWTPAVLAVLEQYRVPATFFLVGTQVLKYPDLVRREVRDGDEIGIHTFSHPHMGALSPWAAALQLSLTDKVIAGATGLHTALYRQPYSARSSDFGGAELAAARRVSHLGYLVVTGTFISNDWAPGSVSELVANVTPSANAGGIVMWHDGGGDRSRTIDALRRYIPAMQRRGYRFVSVSAIAGLSRSQVMHPASLVEHTQGAVLVTSEWLTTGFTSLFGALTALLLVVCVARGILVIWLARRHRRRPRAIDPTFSPPVSVVVPAYNEAAGIAGAVHSIASSRYPNFEVIVVDDGSTDDTARIVSEIGLERVRLVRKPNGGKAEALNAGIAAARNDVLVLVDGDTQLEPETLTSIVQPLRDKEVGGVSGNAKVANRRGLLGAWQHIEYVISCNVERRMFDLLDCMPCVPGAIGAFRREALADVGGISTDTLAEDTDLTMATLRAGWKIRYSPDSRAWTEAPATIRDLWRQRHRWTYGTLQAMWKHRRCVVEPTGSGGRLGRRGLPYLSFYTIVLPVLSPVVDLYALYSLAAAKPVHAIEMWVAVNLITLAVGAYAFHLDDEALAPLALLPLQQFVYRQMMYGVVLQSIHHAFLGVRVRWQHLHRSGEVNSPADVRPAPATGPAAGLAAVGAPSPSVWVQRGDAKRGSVFVDDTGRITRRRRGVLRTTVFVLTASAALMFTSLWLPVPRAARMPTVPTVAGRLTAPHGSAGANRACPPKDPTCGAKIETRTHGT